MTTALAYWSSKDEFMITYPDQSATFEEFCSEGYGWFIQSPHPFTTKFLFLQLPAVLASDYLKLR